MVRSHRLPPLLLVACCGLAALLALPAQAGKPILRAGGSAPGTVTGSIQQTAGLIRRAALIVKRGGRGKRELRGAVTHNQAARASVRENRPTIAVHLTLKARNFAREAIRANQGALTKADAANTPAETKAAAGADPAEAQAAVAEADKTVPSEEQVADQAAAAPAEPGEGEAPPAPEQEAPPTK